MATSRGSDGVLLSPAPRGTNVPGLLLGLLWVAALVVGGFFYLNTPEAAPSVGSDLSGLSQSISTYAAAIQRRIWAYVFLGFGVIGLMIQLGAESVLWHLNRR